MVISWDCVKKMVIITIINVSHTATVDVPNLPKDTVIFGPLTDRDHGHHTGAQPQCQQHANMGALV